MKKHKNNEITFCFLGFILPLTPQSFIRSQHLPGNSESVRGVHMMTPASGGVSYRCHRHNFYVATTGTHWKRQQSHNMTSIVHGVTRTTVKYEVKWDINDRILYTPVFKSYGININIDVVIFYVIFKITWAGNKIQYNCKQNDILANNLFTHI